MSRHRISPPLLIAAWLAFAAGGPLLAAEAGKAEVHPAIRRLTTAELAGWLCKALLGNDGRKLAATLFDGKVPGESDEESWSALVTGDGKDLSAPGSWSSSWKGAGTASPRKMGGARLSDPGRVIKGDTPPAAARRSAGTTRRGLRASPPSQWFCAKGEGSR